MFNKIKNSYPRSWYPSIWHFNNIAKLLYPSLVYVKYMFKKKAQTRLLYTSIQKKSKLHVLYCLSFSLICAQFSWFLSASNAHKRRLAGGFRWIPRRTLRGASNGYAPRISPCLLWSRSYKNWIRKVENGRGGLYESMDGSRFWVLFLFSKNKIILKIMI